MNEDDINRLNERDRMKRLETALDPNVTKFAPKMPNIGEPPIATISADIREHAQALLRLCDTMDKIATSSETDVRAAADLLIRMGARIK